MGRDGERWGEIGGDRERGEGERAVLVTSTNTYKNCLQD